MSYAFDDLIAAELAGREYPDPALVERLAEQRAHELVHARSVEMLGLARRCAARVGPNWLALIEDQASEPWSA